MAGVQPDATIRELFRQGVFNIEQFRELQTMIYSLVEISKELRIMSQFTILRFSCMRAIEQHCDAVLNGCKTLGRPMNMQQEQAEQGMSTLPKLEVGKLQGGKAALQAWEQNFTYDMIKFSFWQWFADASSQPCYARLTRRRMVWSTRSKGKPQVRRGDATRQGSPKIPLQHGRGHYAMSSRYRVPACKVR